MSGLSTQVPSFKPSPGLQAEWDTFRGGLNLLLRPTELSTAEMAQADNIMLVGSGVPTGRWGTLPYFTVNATGSIEGFGTFVNSASLTNEILAVSDQGFLAKKNGSGSTQISGQSFPSGTVVRSEQLGGYAYFVSQNTPLSRYNGTNLEVFVTLSAPTGLTATNFSGASGSFIWSWKVTTLGPNGGETNAPTNVILPNLPQDLTKTEVIISWTAPSAASLSGYQIYRGLAGDETFLGSVGPSTTKYVDVGDPASDTIFPPQYNRTGGIQSPLITKYNDRLLLADAQEKSLLHVSGRYPNQSKFDWVAGGGSVYIDPDSGQDITGIAIQNSSDKIIVFKDYSIYAVSPQYVRVGNYNILDLPYQPISTAIGCSSPDTIVTVENDIFYFGRKGLYVVGYEPNFLSLIRTNEISARIRPYIMLLNDQDFTTCCAMYVNNKYLLSFPYRKEIVVYDRERGCFAGIWKLPFGVTKMKKYVDGTGTEKWVIGTTTNQVYTFEPSINSDNGTTITKTMRTNKEVMYQWFRRRPYKDWSELKIFELFYALLRNVTGTATVNILVENRDGSTSTVKTFDITGSATSGRTGWGSLQWGGGMWGESRGTPVVGSDELPKWSQLYKSGRTIQIEVTSTAANSNFEVLNFKITGNSLGSTSLPSSDRV